MTIFNRDDAIDLPELAAAPAAPEAGRRKVYMAEDGALYAIDSSGNVIPPISQDARIVSLTDNYTLTAEDSGKTFECNGTFAINCPNGLTRNLVAIIVNVGSGIISVTADGTLLSKSGAVTIADQYAMASVYHHGMNIWLLAGDIS